MSEAWTKQRAAMRATVGTALRAAVEAAEWKEQWEQ